jgi:hypothetical protein
VDLFNYWMENISRLVSILQEAVDASTAMICHKSCPLNIWVTRQQTGRRGHPRIQLNETSLATALPSVHNIRVERM